MEEVESKLQTASNRLSCCVHLILMLIQYRFNLDDANAAVLASYLSPDVNDHGDHGWEEITDNAMTELLRTVLAKTQKDATTTGNNSTGNELAMQDDTKKLKKHITIVCDRLGKGATLVGGGSHAPSTAAASPAAAPATAEAK